jgi:hypothetical protein
MTKEIIAALNAAGHMELDELCAPIALRHGYKPATVLTIVRMLRDAKMIDIQHNTAYSLVPRPEQLNPDMQ